MVVEENREKWGVTANGCQASLGDNFKCIKIDRGHGHTAVNALKIIELCT